LGILGSQIEIEHVYSLARVLTDLKCYRLQVDKLDRIITVVKNWLNYSQHKDLIDFLKVEFVLVEEKYDLIEESNYFEQLKLDKD
jgi:hypothetical protein